MLPVLPFIVILGIIGWNTYLRYSQFWLKNKIILKIFWGWFWMLNTILLIILSLSYSKKTRVESMYYLSQKRISQEL